MTQRLLRLGTASFLGLAVCAILAPRVTNYISTSAVVNAPTISVTSPFQGRVVNAPGMATIIRAGQPIASIEPSIEQRQILTELLAERDSKAKQLAALRAQGASLDLRARAEQDSKASYAAFGLRRQEARIQETRAEVAQARARFREIAARAKRSEQLTAFGQIAQATADSDRENLNAAREEVSRHLARLEELLVDKEALAGGVPLGTDNTDHDGRLHQIAMRLADLATETARVEAEGDALDTRIADLRTERFTPLAAGNAVVQSAMARTGDDVRDGEEIARLFDCDRRFLEVAVSEAYFESILPGSRATVRLRGGTDTFEATVTAVRGAGAKPDYPELAAEPQSVPKGQLRVIVALDPADLTGPDGALVAANFCDVGRTAEVRFDRSLAGELRVFGLSLPKMPGFEALARVAAASEIDDADRR